MAVDTESGQTLLRVGCEHGSQINGSGTLCAVEAPYGLGPVGIHIHGLAAIAPAGGYGDGGAYALALEHLGACCAFSHTADGRVGYHALHGSAVAVTEIFSYEVCNCLSKGHGLAFKALAYTALAAVDCRTNANLRMFFHDLYG